ncbi:MAG: glycosyltransferase family 4 protein [Desulfohalobiaceae bacterium]|nr:glycosyltransferase family 4 protein [Desulfohalobiaceae bacterium]
MRLKREEGAAQGKTAVRLSGAGAGLQGNSPRSLRIALVSYRSNPYCGGQGVYVRHLSRALRDLGHRVDVISGEPYPELEPGVGLVPLPGMNCYGYPRFRDALSDRGVSSLRDLREWLGIVSGGFPEPRIFGERVRDYLLAHWRDYDVVHDNQSLGYGLLHLQKRGMPVVSTIHHPISKDLRYALQREERWGVRLLIRRWHGFLRMQKRVARGLKRILTVSHASRRDIERDFGVAPGNTEVVQNGVDTAVFRPLPEEPLHPCRIMATASADVPLKGLNYLLQALDLLRKEFPSVELRVLGKCGENGRTARLIRELDLQDRVVFRSGLSREDIAVQYARSGIAVVPSLYEGFGLPAAEAMACGKPLVATTGGALPEIVGSAGELVPPANAQALAQAVAGLLRRPGYAEGLGRRARQRIADHFTWDQAARKSAEVYRGLAAESPVGSLPGKQGQRCEPSS